MKRIFLDSSVLISFCASTTGASAYVLQKCRQGKLKGYISQRVILEVQKNTEQKIGEKARARFATVLQEGFLTTSKDATPAFVEECKHVINSKDAPILATAIKSRSAFLLTLDRHDFMRPQVATFAAPLKMLTPGDFVKNYLRKKAYE